MLTGANAVRVLRVDPEATVTLTDVIIRNGNAAAGQRRAAASRTSGTLTAIRVLVTQNRTDRRRRRHPQPR